MTLTLATGGNLVYIGPPGGNKTTVAEAMASLVEGVTKDDIAHIPALADLSPSAVVGGETRVTKEALDTNGNMISSEVVRSSLVGIITPQKRIIFSDEVNREAPHAANAALTAHEQRSLVVGGQRIDLPNIIAGVATMNPGEARQGTFPITHAFASRHAAGVILGTNPESEDEIVRRTLSGFSPRPDLMKPVISLERLARLRAATKSEAHVVMPVESILPTCIEGVKTLRNNLAENNIDEAPGRMSRQAIELARAYALIRNEDKISINGIRTALLLISGARYGMLRADAANRIREFREELDNKL